MVGLSERRYRRAEQLAVLVYPLAILAALVLSFGVSSDQPMAGDFYVLFALWFGIVPAAFVTGLLVLVANALFAIGGGSPDRLNVAIAGIMVVTIPLLIYPIVTGAEPVPEPLLFVIVPPFSLGAGPLALVVHAFRLPTRLRVAVRPPWSS